MSDTNVVNLSLRNGKSVLVTSKSNALNTQKAVVTITQGGRSSVHTFTGQGENADMAVDGGSEKSIFAMYPNPDTWDIKVELLNKPSGASDFSSSRAKIGAVEKTAEGKNVWEIVSEDSTDNDNNDTVLRIESDGTNS